MHAWASRAPVTAFANWLKMTKQQAGSGSGTGGGESAGPVRNFGAGVLLFTTYALFVVCNTVGTACLPSMIEDVGFSAGTGSTIAGFQTAAQVTGKVTFAGRLADARRLRHWPAPKKKSHTKSHVSIK